jgi:hypothetical protein
MTLNHQKQLKKVYGGIMKEVNKSWLQIASKNTLSAIDHQVKTINTNIAKVQAQNVVFWPLDDIELVGAQIFCSACSLFCMQI